MKRICVAVIGIGRVGLPLALVLASEGYKVYGIGRSAQKIEELKFGRMPFIEENAEDILKKTLGKNFLPTISYECLAKSQYIILTLGTPVDENMNPILDQINEALEKSKKFLKPNQTLILRSTVSPGTTSYVESILDGISGLKVGQNFFLAFCPERIAEGKAIVEIKTIPQIVGGVDKKSTKMAERFWQSIGVRCLPTDAISAELAKLFTNMYRYINFAVANEFMVIAGNFHKDIYEIVNLVNKDYKRGGLSLPGLTGGPCLFKDGFFLISDFPFIDLIATSWKINESIPLYLVKKIRERVKLENKKIALLGLAFKAEIDDIRESLSFKVRKAFLRERAKVILHDPYVTSYQNQEVAKNVYETVAEADVIFIATNHKAYQNLNIGQLKKLVKKNCVICDVWNVLKTDRIVFTINQLSKNSLISAKTKAFPR